MPTPNALEVTIRGAIHMHDEKYASERFGACNTKKAPLVLPSLGPGKKRILYTIYEYSPLLDSSNMTMDDWMNIAKDLQVTILRSPSPPMQPANVGDVKRHSLATEMVQNIRRLRNPARDRHAVVHGVGPVVHAGKSGQTGHCYGIADSHLRSAKRRP